MLQQMDKALKERIIGAAVLVVFAILVVPVFLDGPDDGADDAGDQATETFSSDAATDGAPVGQGSA